MFSIDLQPNESYGSIVKEELLECKVEVPSEYEEWSIPPTVDLNSYDELMKDGEFSCDLCPRVFLTRYKLAQHEMLHIRMYLTMPQMYVCDHCAAIYVDKQSMTKHVRKHDANKKDHTCNICEKKFTYRNWHEHVRNVHSTSTYKCELCLKIFKCKRTLKRHRLYIHEGFKPLWMMKSRTNDAMHTCEVCKKSFKTRSSLGQHWKNVHADEGKKFKCDICKSQLKSANYLRTHIRRVHYDDGNLHECNICKKKFKSPRYMKVHVKNSHLKKTSKINAGTSGKVMEMSINREVKVEKVNVQFDDDLLIEVGKGPVTSVILWENM